MTRENIRKKLRESFGLDVDAFSSNVDYHDVGSWTKTKLSEEQTKVLLGVHRIVTEKIKATQGYRDPDGNEMIMIIQFDDDVDIVDRTYQLDLKILDRVSSEGYYTESDKSKLNAYRTLFKRLLNKEIWMYRWI